MILNCGGKLIDGLGIPDSAKVRKKCRSHARVDRMQDSYGRIQFPYQVKLFSTPTAEIFWQWFFADLLSPPPLHLL